MKFQDLSPLFKEALLVVFKNNLDELSELRDSIAIDEPMERRDDKYEFFTEQMAKINRAIKE